MNKHLSFKSYDESTTFTVSTDNISHMLLEKNTVIHGTGSDNIVMGDRLNIYFKSKHQIELTSSKYDVNDIHKEILKYIL